jgi:hypothetical protein
MPFGSQLCPPVPLQLRIRRTALGVADAELGKVFEQAEYPHDPQDYGNHNNAIQDALDLALHGDEAIHKPQKQADYAQGDNHGN